MQDRQCTGGIIEPGIFFTAGCDGSPTVATVQESYANLNFGPVITVSTPGYSGALTWTINSVTSFTPGCSLPTSRFTFSSTSRTSQLRVGATALDYPTCPAFTITYSVKRSNDDTAIISCSVDVTVAQVAKRPIIVDCANRSVDERSIVGTSLAPPFAATNLNLGTSILWFVNYTTSGQVPFSVGMCDGQLRVLREFLWKDRQSYKIDLTVRNDGSALDIGTSEVTCSMYVNVNMVPLPPVITSTTFYVPELSPVGTEVGVLTARDPNNFTLSNWRFTATDTPDAFSILPSGVIRVKLVQDTLLTLKSVYTYRVNVSNPYVQGTSLIAINMVPVLRPPVITDQTRSIAENAAVNTNLGLRLLATHPQSVAFTFSMNPTTPFNVQPNGQVYVSAAGMLDYNVQREYVPSIIVTDANGLTATAALTISLIEVNKPPVWCCGASFAFTVDEGKAISEPVFGSPALSATDPNALDSLTFRLLSAVPTSGNRTFTVDAFTGAIAV
ncbi:cadherin repeat domain-containing protein, partial [archaeon]